MGPVWWRWVLAGWCDSQPGKRRVYKVAFSFNLFCLWNACDPPTWSIGIHRDICLPSNSEDWKALTLIKCHLNILSTPACVSWQLGQIWKMATFWGTKAHGPVSEDSSAAERSERRLLWGQEPVDKLWNMRKNKNNQRKQVSKQKNRNTLNEWINGPPHFSAECQAVNDLGFRGRYSLCCSYSTMLAWKQPWTVCAQLGTAGFQ